MTFIGKIFASFDTTPEGFSGRKLSAFVTIISAIVLAFKFGTSENVTYLVGILLTFALLCLGIVTAEQLLRLYKDSKGQPDDAPEQPAPNVEVINDVKVDQPVK